MGLKLKNCPSCGKLYADTGIGMCRDCYEKELEDEAEAARYVRDNPKSSVKEICEATGIKERVILRMIKNGRFIETGVEVSYPCESCGTMITRGRYCDKCNEKLAREVAASSQKMAAKLPPRQKAMPGRDSSRGMYTKHLDER